MRGSVVLSGALVLVMGLLPLSLPPGAGEGVGGPRPMGPPGETVAPVRSDRGGPALRGEVDARVRVQRLPVLDRPAESGFVVVDLGRGDRIRVKVDQAAPLGWVAIASTSTSIMWIRESDLELEDRAPGQAEATTAWVRAASAPVRSGNPGAKLPGPPRGRLPQGTMVHLIDRPPLRFGPTSSASRWLAIVPPAETTFFVRFDALEWCPPDPGRAAPAEVLASYEEPAADGKGREQRAVGSRAWPPEVSAEIERLDGVYRVIVSSQPIEQWRFETLRAGYQGLLKRAGDRSDLEDALRSRLARLTQSEQASRSARTIETILAKSRRRDQQISGLKRDLARLDQSRDRGFDVVGYIQPSARKADGTKLFALIGSEGTRIAYLEIPPGLDPEPYLAHRVGVRGRARFSEDLGSRLISVRDMERVAER